MNGSTGAGYDTKGKGRASYDQNGGNDFLALDMGSGNNPYGDGDGSMQQMQQLQTQQVRSGRQVSMRQSSINSRARKCGDHSIKLTDYVLFSLSLSLATSSS